jgi:hypothetical protein
MPAVIPPRSAHEAGSAISCTALQQFASIKLESPFAIKKPPPPPQPPDPTTSQQKLTLAALNSPLVTITTISCPIVGRERTINIKGLYSYVQWKVRIFESSTDRKKGFATILTKFRQDVVVLLW